MFANVVAAFLIVFLPQIHAEGLLDQGKSAEAKAAIDRLTQAEIVDLFKTGFTSSQARSFLSAAAKPGPLFTEDTFVKAKKLIQIPKGYKVVFDKKEFKVETAGGGEISIDGKKIVFADRPQQDIVNDIGVQEGPALVVLGFALLANPGSEASSYSIPQYFDFLKSLCSTEAGAKVAYSDSISAQISTMLQREKVLKDKEPGCQTQVNKLLAKSSADARAEIAANCESSRHYLDCLQTYRYGKPKHEVEHSDWPGQ